MTDRIPVGHRMVKLFQHHPGAATPHWSWHTLDANYRRIKTAGEAFEDKASARRAAERAEGVTFPEDQDFVLIPDPVATAEPVVSEDVPPPAGAPGAAPFPESRARGGLSAGRLVVGAVAMVVAAFLVGFAVGDNAGYDRGQRRSVIDRKPAAATTTTSRAEIGTALTCTTVECVEYDQKGSVVKRYPAGEIGHSTSGDPPPRP